MSKPIPLVLRFWANHREDDCFRVELQYPDGSVEQTVITISGNGLAPYCNDFELSDADAYSVFWHGEEDGRFQGFDRNTDAAWLECNKAFAKRMAS